MGCHTALVAMACDSDQLKMLTLGLRPRLQWSHKMPRGWALPGTAQIGYTLKGELSFGHCVFINLLLLQVLHDLRIQLHNFIWVPRPTE